MGISYVILTSEEHLVTSDAVSYLLQSSGGDIKAVVLTRQKLKVPMVARAFIAFGFVAFASLVWATLKHAILGIGLPSKLEKQGIPVIDYHKGFWEEHKQLLQNCDYGLCLMWPHILRDGQFSLPKSGFLNIHGALLPKYRGVYPLFYALINRERYVGATLHRIDGEIDTGEIVSQAVVDTQGKTRLRVLKMQYLEAARLFVDFVYHGRRHECSGENSVAAEKEYLVDPFRYFSKPKIADMLRLLVKSKLGR